MLDIIKLKELFKKDEKDILSDFFAFLRFKSITTDPNYHQEVQKCAQWLAEYLNLIGLSVEVWDTDKAPIIFAHDLRAGPEKETLLIYCHYDVQPVDPIEGWTTPPFEPTMRDGQVYARGAVDDKGQCFYTIVAIKTFLKQFGQFPFNLKFVIDGEEESGSLGFSQILEDKRKSLSADHLLIVDSGMEKIEKPTITLGARGIVSLEVIVKESNHDLHSGFGGGIAYNPNRALAEILAKLHDENGSVAISGFYDEVVEMPPHEKKGLSFDFDPGHFFSLFGFEPTGMEKGLSPIEANWLRPTLEINGINGGYSGPGWKTVIPSVAQAKISCRLVPHQSPDRIIALVRDFLINQTPPGLNTTVNIFPANGRGFRTNPNSRIAHLIAESYSQVFQKPCQKSLIGATIPIAAQLAEVSGAEMVLAGLGLPADRIHAPDEHFGFDRFENGYLTIYRLFELFN
ncbi:MAG: M20/M25/M40 family metallo-hydrolase [Chlamydiales bacterium]